MGLKFMAVFTMKAVTKRNEWKIIAKKEILYYPDWLNYYFVLPGCL